MNDKKVYHLIISGKNLKEIEQLRYELQELINTHLHWIDSNKAEIID